MYPDRVSDGPTWSRIGGHLALDLCNTRAWRLDPARSVDRLAGPRDLSDWFHAVVGTPRPVLPDDTAFHDVVRLRDAAIGLIDAHLDQTVADARDVAVVHGGWLAALAVADVAPRLPLSATVPPSTAPLLACHLALAVGELLRRPDLSTLRRCDGVGCGWLFLDATRNHSRRWCDSEDCGNRARVRAYQHRRGSRAGAPQRP
jgi:predicted RNA-binding Zn ribbon-like protein